MRGGGGNVLVSGRKGAFSADTWEGDRVDRAKVGLGKMEGGLFELALAHRERGGSWGGFLECASGQAARAYGAGERADGPAASSSTLNGRSGVSRCADALGGSQVFGKEA